MSEMAPSYAPTGYRPNHPRSVAALVVAIVAVLGVCCGLTLVAGPIAVYLGASVMREIDREPDRWSGRGQAKAALIMGVIATALLVVFVLLMALGVVGTVITNGYDSGYPR